MTEVRPDHHAEEGIVLAVRLGQDLHAIPVGAVEEVLPALPIESVPNMPAFVRGVVFVRGHVIPVLSAAQRLGLHRYERPDEPYIVCLRVGHRIIGVEFDEALDLIDIAGDELLAAEQLGSFSGFFTGVIDHDGKIIRLLDPEKLINETEATLLPNVADPAETAPLTIVDGTQHELDE